MPGQFADIEKNFVDRVLEYFSPHVALRRTAARLLLRQYAAAKITRSTGGWAPVDSDSNEIIRTSQQAVRARVRQLVRDFPYFARALNVIVDLTVGDGIAFQARVKDNSGKLNKKLNSQIEAAFDRWCDEADIMKRLHFSELTRLSERSETETGESLFMRRRVEGRFLPLAIQAIEPDRLSTCAKNNITSNSFCDGIEYDAYTGEVVAYHVLSGEFNSEIIRIPASEIIHTFDTLRPGQMRGISAFVCAVLCADDISNYIDSTLDTAKLAARYLAFIKTPDIAGLQLQGVTDTDDDGKKIEDMENAIIQYLRPGEEVNIASHNVPNEQFEAFTRFVLRMTAIGTGISYELLTGDYSGLSYSNLKTIRADLIRVVRPRFFRRKKHFCTPVFRWFLEDLALSGKVPMPGYFKNSWMYEACEWQWQGMESPDPLRDGKAAINMIDQNMMSPQEVLAARGRDAEDVLDEIAAFEAMKKEKGVIDKPVSLTGQNNPASLGG